MLNHSRLGTVLCIISISGLSCFARAEDGHLAGLYAGLLADGNQRGFVAFSRELVIPKREPGGRTIELPNGQTATVIAVDKDYFALVQDGPRFILAFSTKRPVIDERQFMQAEALYGYDGESYWSLRLDKPMRFVPDGWTNSLSELPDNFAWNALTIIPRSEADRPQGKYASDDSYRTIREHYLESLRVAQLGATNTLQQAPHLEGSVLSLVHAAGTVQKAELLGPPNKPSEIRLENQYGRQRSALLDYASDTVTIRSAFGGKIVSETRYRLLAFRSPALIESPSAFSWRLYREGAGNLIGALMTNGATVNVEFTKQGGLVPRHVMEEPRRIKTPSLVPIYVLFGLAAAGAGLLVRRAMQHKPNRQKSEI